MMKKQISLIADIVDDYRVRLRKGEKVTIAQFAERHPEVDQVELRKQLECVSILNETQPQVESEKLSNKSRARIQSAIDTEYDKLYPEQAKRTIDLSRRMRHIRIAGSPHKPKSKK